MGEKRAANGSRAGRRPPKQVARDDFLVILALAALSSAFSVRFHVVARFAGWALASANQGLEPFLLVPVVAGLAVAGFGYRRWRELRQQVRAATTAYGELRAVLDATNEAILLVGGDRRFLAANRRVEALFGVSGAEFLSQGSGPRHALVERIFADADGFLALVAGAARDTERRFQTTVAQVWPERRELELYSAPVPRADGTALGRLYAFQDVTRERSAERAKREFIGLVSHELRTPLTSIKGYVDLLLAGDVGELAAEQREFLETVGQNANRLVAIVNDLLDLTGLEEGKVALRRVALDLAAVLADATRALRPQVDAKGQLLTTDVAADLPRVCGDGGRLFQVVANLLSNAHKYTPAGGAVRVTATSADGRVRIAVQDTGIGMSQDELRQLFTRFYRAKNRATSDVGGVGLGLVITKMLVELHGGELTVESAPGQGSVFRVSLPVAASEAATPEAPDPGPHAARPPDGEGTGEGG